MHALGQLTRRRLAFVRERLEEQDRLGERADRVVPDDRLVRAEDLGLRHVPSVAGFHILDSQSAYWYCRATRWP